jgi:hypothetical protein
MQSATLPDKLFRLRSSLEIAELENLTGVTDHVYICMRILRGWFVCLSCAVIQSVPKNIYTLNVHKPHINIDRIVIFFHI